MKNKEIMTVKHLETGETRLIVASRFNAELHELIDQKVKKTPVIEAKEVEKIEVKEVIEKVENECEICGQICKSASGLKVHMKKHLK